VGSSLGNPARRTISFHYIRRTFRMLTVLFWVMCGGLSRAELGSSRLITRKINQTEKESSCYDRRKYRVASAVSRGVKARSTSKFNQSQVLLAHEIQNNTGTWATHHGSQSLKISQDSHSKSNEALPIYTTCRYTVGRI
jgi:hypothetical protein